MPDAGRRLVRFSLLRGCLGRRTPDGKVIETDTDTAMYLLDGFAVPVAPGRDFMVSPYIRSSYASSLEDLTRACDRFIAACAALSRSISPMSPAKRLRARIVETSLLHIMAAHSQLSRHPRPAPRAGGIGQAKRSSARIRAIRNQCKGAESAARFDLRSITPSAVLASRVRARSSRVQHWAVASPRAAAAASEKTLGEIWL